MSVTYTPPNPIGLATSILNPIAGIYNIFSSERNYQANKKAQEENLKFEKEKWEYDKAMQQNIFNREDNSVQRRVADLKAAGINPIFAAGQGADAGSHVAMTAPQRDMHGVNSAEQRKLDAMYNSMQFLKMKSEIDHTEADTNRLRVEAEGRKDEIEHERHMRPGYRAEQRLNMMLLQEKVNNREIQSQMLRLERDERLQQLDRNEIDILAKLVALQQARHNLTEDQRDAFIRRAVGLMKGQSPVGIQGAINQLMQMSASELYYLDVDSSFEDIERKYKHGN